jgi:GTPase SAR1 family protein
MSNLATGATELMLAMQTPTPKGYWGVPVLVWGAPGTGKSTFIESLQRDGFPVYTMIASLHDPTDFNGLPVLHNGRMRFAPPEWVYLFEEHGQGILFLDELTTAPPTVQAALLRLVLERKVGAHSLPAGVRIVAAANPPDIAASGWELSPPLANRFVHLNWQLDGDTYRRALEEGFAPPPALTTDPERHAARALFWKQLVAGFLKRNAGMAFTQPAEDEYAFATPRSWDFAIALMATCDLHGYAPRPGEQSPPNTQPFVNLIKGAVGSGAATSFLQYLRQLRIPDPEAVLDGAAQVDPTLREDELLVLFETMSRLLQAMSADRTDEARLKSRTRRFLEAAQVVAHVRKADSIYTVFRRLIHGDEKKEGKSKSDEKPQEDKSGGWLQRRLGEDEGLQPILRELGQHYEELTGILERLKPKG